MDGGCVFQIQTRSRHPYRVHVGPDKLFVTEFKPGWCDSTGDHQLRLPEEILVVLASLATECRHQSWLAAATCTPAALRIVRWRGRDVPQMYNVQVADVHTQLIVGEQKRAASSPRPKRPSRSCRIGAGICPVCAPPSTPTKPRAVSLYNLAKNSFAFRSTFLSRSARIHLDRIGSGAGGAPSPSRHWSDPASSWIPSWPCSVVTTVRKFPLRAATSALMSASTSLTDNFLLRPQFLPSRRYFPTFERVMSRLRSRFDCGRPPGNRKMALSSSWSWSSIPHGSRRFASTFRRSSNCSSRSSAFASIAISRRRWSRNARTIFSRETGSVCCN